MGSKDNVSPATQKLKPVLQTVASICVFAVNKIDRTVREVAVGKLNQYYRDEQARSEITQLAADFAKNTGAYVIKEGIKTVPGGVPVYNIVLKSLRNGGDKKLEEKEEKIKELEARMKELVARIEKLENQSPKLRSRI